MTRPMIVVTGGAGFIGSNIVARLCALGTHDVVVCDHLRTADSGKWRNIARHDVADIWSPETLFDDLDACAGNVEAVVHMGAISSTTEPDAERIIEQNFRLSRDLWHWCEAAGARLIYASSAATYGAGEQGFVDDNSAEALGRLRPLNAYGYSKALFDRYAVRHSVRGSAPVQWAGLKFFNVYGPNEYHKGGMKSVVAQIWPSVRAGEPVRLFRSHHPDYADGGQLRDFVYVDDVVDQVMWLLATREVSGIFNAGSGEARSFADLAAATLKAAGREPDITFIDMPEAIRERYQYYTRADMSRARAAGFVREPTRLEDGVHRYVSQFLMHDDPYR